MKRFLMSVLVALVFLCLLPTPPSQAATFPIVGFSRYSGDLADLRGGFWFNDGELRWIPGLISHQTYSDPGPQFYTTRAIWQSDGIIEATAAGKGIDLSTAAGGVALNTCVHDGAIVWVRPHTAPDWTPVYAVDCASREHYQYHATWVNSALELSYTLAEHFGVLSYRNQWGGIGMPFDVCTANDPSVCVGEAVDYRDWFETVVRYE